MKKIFFAFILFLLLLGLAIVWWRNGTEPANPFNKTPKIFVIEKGQGVREIANKLKQEGLIRDPVVFFLLIKQLSLDEKIQAGSFRLSPEMSAEQIAKELTHGTLDIWVTIPEGKRGEEVFEILKQNLPNSQPSWQTEFVKYEGFLFPDTYLIPKDADINAIIKIMTDNFERKFQTLPSNQGLSKNEIVTIASLIEREAKHAQDRPLVASVILNRLNIGMKLDIDATIQYALGYQEDSKTWWKKELTREDLNINSAYNTYKNSGLPPTPIANPGLAALQAVVNPANTDYLYYISDKQGNNHYAKTIEEHDANIKRYGL